MSTIGNDELRTERSSSYRAWMRATAGLCILSAIVYWVVRQGSLQQLNLWGVVSSIIIFFTTNAVNAGMLQAVARMYGRDMKFRLALQAATLGSLGNATGGLPIGTTLKYVILSKRVGLTIAQITFALIGVAAAMALTLLAFTAVSIFTLQYPLTVKLLPGLLLVVGLCACAVLLRSPYLRNRFPTLFGPLFSDTHLRTLILYSGSLATLSVLNYLAIGWHFLPDRPAMTVIFISSSGMLVGLASLLQSIGGLQEILMGVTALAAGTHAVDGVQLALVIRATSILSSGLTLGGAYLFSRR